MLREKVPGSPGRGTVARYKGRTRFLLKMTPVSEKVTPLVTVLAWSPGSPVFTPWSCINQGLAPTCNLGNWKAVAGGSEVRDHP